ncbi:MAG: hypothetical protein AB7K24_03125 [Gemmataceae bacterium]
MSQAEWMEADAKLELRGMLKLLRASHSSEAADADRPLLTARKFRLFAAACCRGIWDLFDDTCREVVQTADLYADGGADAGDLAHANARVEQALAQRLPDFPPVVLQYGIADLEQFLLPIFDDRPDWKERLDASWGYDSDPDLLRAELAVYWIYCSALFATAESTRGAETT